MAKKTQRLYEQQIATSTCRLYASDWKTYQTFCHQHHIDIALPESVALFLTAQFEQGIHPSTLTRRIAAIKFWFVQHDQLSPTETSLVRSVLKGIRRDEKARPSQPKKALSIKILKEMVDMCDTTTLRGLRDKALLLLGFAGAYRRSELVQICIEDMALNDKGVDIVLKKSKTDQEGKGRVKSILKAKDLNYCPIQAINNWMSAAHLTHGPLFRGIRKNTILRNEALNAMTMYELVRSLTFKLGYEALNFSPHSLRSGFVTAAIENNARPSKIMSLTHHRSLKSLQSYIHHAERFDQHPAKDLL